MAKHSKHNRDLEKLDKPTLQKKRVELIRDFIDPTTDEAHAEELMEQLGEIDAKLLDG